MNETTTVEQLTPAMFKKLRDEALDLEMADKFLAAVEQKNQLISGLPFDPQRLYAVLTVLAASSSSDKPEEIENDELMAESELASWRETLEIRNSMIETYHIRRFYDHAESALDMGLLVSLSRVFHSLPYSELNKSKYDLVVTRLFTKGNVETMRYLPLPREKVAEALVAILPAYTDSESEHDVERVVEGFDHFIGTLKEQTILEEFVEKGSFESLRLYKRDLGKLFFHPRVTAAAIECNVTIGNIFAGLVNQVNGPLYDLINTKFDFAGAFHDVSPSAKSNVLAEFDIPEVEEEAVIRSSERDQLRGILEMIGGVEKREIAPGQEVADLVEHNSEEDESELSAGERVNDILMKLSSENPDYESIREETEKYEGLRSIDLEYLFAGGSAELNELCRDVLAVIVWTEELCANELQEDDTLTEVTQSEGATLIQLSEKYQKELQDLLEVAEEKDQNRVLLISNKLLASHLDLKRLFVRFTSSKLAKV